MTCTYKVEPEKRRGCITGLIIRLIINSCALYVAALLISGLHIGGWGSILFVALVFGCVNALIKPFVSCVTCLLQILTLGLFTLVINACMLYITSWFADLFGLDFTIDNFLSAFLGAIIVSVVSIIMSKVLK